MKFLLIVVLVLVVAWRWRSAQKGAIATRRSNPDAQAGPISMVVCAHCGVHIPTQDAVTGQTGTYCSEDHRAAAES